MKSVSKFYALLISLIVFWMSILVYDDYLTNSVSSLGLTEEIITFFFEGDISIEQTNDLFNDFIKLAETNELDVYQIYMENEKFYVYARSSDDMYLENLILSDNYIDNLIDFHSISNKFSSQDGILYDPIITNDVRILPLKDSFIDSDFNFKGPYVVDASQSNSLNNVINIIENSYENVYFNIDYLESVVETGVLVSQSDYIILFLVASSYAIFLFIHIIKNSKKSILYKQEGYTNLQVYSKFTLKYILLTFTFSFISLIILTLLFIPIYAIKLNLVFQLAYYLVTTFIFCITLSLIVFLLITKVPVNLQIKGKSFLSNAVSILRVVKLVLVVFSFNFIIFSFSLVTTSVTNLTNLSNYKDMYQSMFSIESVKSVYLSEMSKIDNQMNLNEILDQEVRMFLFDKNIASYTNNVFSEDQSVDLNISGNVYIADYNYSLIAGFAEYIDLEDLENELLVVDVNFDMNKCINLDICNKQIIRIDYDKFALPNYQKSLDSVDKNIFKIPNQKLNKNDVILVGNYTDSPYGKTFIFDGDVKEAQKYIDSMTEKVGLYPLYNVRSIIDNNEIMLKYSFASSVNVLINSLLIIFNFCLLSYQLLISKVEINRRRIILMKNEGYRLIQIIRKWITSDLIDYTFTNIIMSVILAYPIKDVILLILFWLLIDSILYLLIIRREINEG